MAIREAGRRIYRNSTLLDQPPGSRHEKWSQRRIATDHVFLTALIGKRRRIAGRELWRLSTSRVQGKCEKSSR
ncbi:hypothetical protein [Bradyrhizobium icense]|uniref:hypothetical protein n=1 Tax=Bradyrhizobium icense TaxID=1274631 RepID=UPI0012EA9A55|nr:hypothetical protein [Bradyrhizobium icense]